MSMTDFGHVPPDPRVKELEAKIEAALAIAENRLERTRSWSDVRTHDERNALRALIKALKGES